MLARDGDFGLLFVVHFQHEAGFEPGHDLFDVVDVDQIRAMRAPERFSRQRLQKFIESAVVRGALEILGADRDKAAFNRSEDQVFGVDQK